MLKRELSFIQATALNMIDMVGIGPFVTTAVVATIMGSAPLAILAWAVGMVLAFIDASVWSELGAKFPKAGGTYSFLRETYGKNSLGKMMSFLFVWQTTFQAPLVITSGALGFTKYLGYVYGGAISEKNPIIAAGIVVVLVGILYRDIRDIGKISVVLWGCVLITMAIVIAAGVSSGNFTQICTQPIVLPENGWLAALGVAAIPTMYSYLGYYNVCHLGAEVKHPERVIPRSMMVSIAGIGVLYLLMQLSIFSVLPHATVANSPFVVSTFIQSVFGTTTATVVTILVLVVALASLFSVVLGYTRIPYAAAVDGMFFPIFKKLHPTKNFPHISLLLLGSVAVICCLTLSLVDSIKAIVIMRVFTQFIAQIIGLMYYRHNVGAENMPWRMWLYPIPALLAICVWLWIFYSADSDKQQLAIIVPCLGVVVFLLVEKFGGFKHDSLHA